MQLVAKCMSHKPINADRLWSLLGNTGHVAQLGPLLLVASALAGLNIVLFGFWVVGGGPRYWIVSFLCYAFLMLVTGGRLSHVFERTVDLHLELDKLAAVIGIFEKRSFRPFPRDSSRDRTVESLGQATLGGYQTTCENLQRTQSESASVLSYCDARRGPLGSGVDVVFAEGLQPAATRSAGLDRATGDH